MSRHRTLRTKVRRGIAGWPITIIGVVALLVLGWFGWRWIGDVVDQRAAVQAGDCNEGPATLKVAATPSVADAVRQVAQAWSAQRPVVYDHCIGVEVLASDSEVVLEGLTNTWDEEKLGSRPHAWVTDSAVWANRLAAQRQSMIGSPPESIATSPVVLAMPQEAADAVQAGPGFRWTDLTAMTSSATGWDRFGKAGWGAFKVAMPDPAVNPGTAMALEAALAGAGADPTGPVTADLLAQEPVKQAMAKLVAARPEQTTTSTWQAMAVLAANPAVGSVGFSAVPALEVDLYRHNTGAEDNRPAPATPLAGVAAQGVTPVADFPFTALSGEWVNEAQARAAQAFRTFLKAPEQRATLAAAGLRVEGVTERPSPAPGIAWAEVTEQLKPADAAATQQVAGAWATADNGQVVTVLVDTSKTMGEDGGDGRTRLEWVREALTGQANRAVSGSLGLWEFATGADGDKAYRELVPTGSVGAQRQSLLDAVGRLKPRGDDRPFTALIAAYEDVLADHRDGKRNRIVVITDGGADGDLSPADAKAHLEGLKVAGKDVGISVVALGGGADGPGLFQDITKAFGGGTVSVVEDGSGVDAALGQVLAGR
ncbi:substrate-binding domain-containing protein [Actinosynnema mirum]|uniref:von Willebrand factor type A n=1 Tax=Actinosynnema mirum (strain ATCC 29888 / DSM 43827 / JCM 3225 / NBRC 14064 / NCIMB 13271 / NRRL B-12336 / IMRU 3971 / 101) TaxID=446462 RepID=C6W995_ACTMD|nr:substrate-binding domain-containing protein [Actinosynnema mirum]ACU39167.1 von Willebrand factor type A [Actinosynnema mirum DSM 43827]